MMMIMMMVEELLSCRMWSLWEEETRRRRRHRVQQEWLFCAKERAQTRKVVSANGLCRNFVATQRERLFDGFVPTFVL